MKSILFVAALLLISGQAQAGNPLEGLPKSVVDKHIALNGPDNCQDDLPSGSEVFEIAKGKKLYIVPCIMGAYQGSGQVYVTSNNDLDVEPVIVLAYDEIAKGVVGTTNLGDPTYDSKTKILSSSGRGRGIGDCGQSSASRIIVDEYGGVSVKTVEIRAKIKCDGKLTKWPVVFKQK
jgi:hypothetical protein